MSETTVYICADSTLTYGPKGGRKKIVKEALPVAVVPDEDTARLLILTFGRRSYDDPIADPHFTQQMKGRPIPEGYGPDHRYYYSGADFEKDNVDTLPAVRERIGQWIERLKR